MAAGRLQAVRFHFGKYRDKLVSEVALDDPGYLRWLLENVDIRDEALREAVELAVEQIDNDPEDPPEWRYDHDY